MAWETSNRRAELPPDWKDRVKAVWKRDGGRCRWLLPVSGERCPRKGADVDHRYGPTRHEISDLWLLCRHHHDKKTQREAWAGRTKRKTPKRPQERHPGLI
jgi:hypothetical protein